MPEVFHDSIGMNEIKRHNEIIFADQRKKQIINRYLYTPIGVGIDQLAVWFILFLAASVVSTYSIVKIFMLAIR